MSGASVLAHVSGTQVPFIALPSLGCGSHPHGDFIPFISFHPASPHSYSVVQNSLSSSTRQHLKLQLEALFPLLFHPRRLPLLEWGCCSLLRSPRLCSFPIPPGCQEPEPVEPVALDVGGPGFQDGKLQSNVNIVPSRLCQTPVLLALLCLPHPHLPADL